jgi:hypothetical protein
VCSATDAACWTSGGVGVVGVSLTSRGRGRGNGDRRPARVRAAQCRGRWRRRRRSLDSDRRRGRHSSREPTAIMMAIRFARGTPWEFKLRGISTTKSTRSVLKAEFKAMGVQELQVERDLDDEVDEESRSRCAELRGKIRALQVGNPACQDSSLRLCQRCVCTADLSSAN